MTGPQRREQLLDVARGLFAERGYDGASIEEIANRAGVTKPVVYEHFGSKDGLYALLVEREMQRLEDDIVGALTARHPRAMLERATDALLAYVEEEPDGFRVLVRDSPRAGSTELAHVMDDVASRLELVLREQFRRRGYKPTLAPMYARALVGMVAYVGEWWLDTRSPPRREVSAHLVNLAWNGLGRLQPAPRVSKGARTRRDPARRS